MSIDWVPLLNVPMHRRLELLAAGFQMLLLLFGQLICMTIFVFLLLNGNAIVRTACVAYLVFMYYDRHAGDTGGRGAGSEWVRNWIIWKYFVNYFPVDLVKTVDLPADRHYLFAIFPHGIIGSGSFANFNTNYSKWRQLFPGIRSKFTTLSMHLYTPIFRELILGWGMAAASANAITTLLMQSNDEKDSMNADGFTSNGVMLLVGGAREALYAHRNMYKIVLKQRRGFIRIAMKTGTSIVPVISFGETGVFDQPANPPGSFMRKMQEIIKKYTGVAPILFNGRGFFQYNFGVIPKRCPITQVVGAPIELVKNPEPSMEEINAVHVTFCKALQDLFETHKSKYIENSEKVQLEIV